MDNGVKSAVSNEMLLGAFAYLLGPISGIPLLIIEKKNAFIRFHAMQSTLVFGAMLLFHIALAIMPILGWILWLILSPVVFIGSFVLWIFLMWKAYSGQMYKLPYFGDLTERQLEKLKKRHGVSK